MALHKPWVRHIQPGYVSDKATNFWEGAVCILLLSWWWWWLWWWLCWWLWWWWWRWWWCWRSWLAAARRMSATPGKQELAAVKSRASQFTIPSHNHNPQFQSQLTIQFQIIDLPFTSQFIISIIQDSQLDLQFTIQINTILIHNPIHNISDAQTNAIQISKALML